MAKIDTLTVDVDLDVDRRTAETCLRLVEMYCNRNGSTILFHDCGDGEVQYELA